MKSRQVGYSFAFSYLALKKCLIYGNDQLIVSASQRQSSHVMSYVEKFTNGFLSLPEFQNIKLVVDARTEKRFSNGKHILSLPPNPETIRGFPGDVFLDEFALYKNESKVYEAILPSITGGHKERKYNLRISSTPLGLNNKFYEIYTSEKFKKFARYRLNIYDAIEKSEGRFKPDMDEIKANVDEQSFRQEYLCEFIDEATAYFTYELLKECIEDYEPSNIKGVTYIGIDVGRTHDRTAIAVVTESSNRRYLKKLEVLHKMEFNRQKEIIKQVIFEEQPEKVFIDKTGLGMQIAEELEEDYSFCEGVTMTNTIKSDCCTTTRKFMENKDFKFLDNEDGRQLISEAHAIQKKVSSNNNILFESPRDNQGHGDRIWAVMLGLLASKQTQYQPSLRTLG